MNRRRFLKSATATGLVVGLSKATGKASIPEHNWDKYDWGWEPPVPHRLYQGPFPQYGPGAVVPDANDGIAPVPGVLRLSVLSDDNKINVSGCVDPGYPKTMGVHQAMLMLPASAKWEGLRLKAELAVKGMRYPVRWACRQKVNSDGSLTLRHNYKPDKPLV